jgi:hypothetical protein
LPILYNSSVTDLRDIVETRPARIPADKHALSTKFEYFEGCLKQVNFRHHAIPSLFRP